MRFVTSIFLLLALPVWAEGEKAGDFDYFVLALSWSPTWCELEGDARNAEQCEEDFGWTLHGLWPQFEAGWPSYCRTGKQDPSRAMTRAMADIMGSDGLAWYQWKKHGRCSGLSAEDYFSASRLAYERVNRPEIFRKLPGEVKLPARVVEQAFQEANPDLGRDMLTVTCKQGRIQEVRLCLDKGLNPRNCGADVRQDCLMNDALMSPVR